MAKKNSSISLLRIVLLSIMGATACLVLLVVLDITTTLGRHFRPDSTSESTRNCSWIKQSPHGWDCQDNWESGYRVITTSQKDKRMTLEMAPQFYALPQLTCNASFPYSILPYHPSASGLTFPSLCFRDDGVLAVSQWDQDDWTFRFSARNVTRDLYLDNLAIVGRSSSLK